MNYQTQLVLACFYTSTNSTTARKADPGSLVSDNVGHPIFFSFMTCSWPFIVAGSCPRKTCSETNNPPLRWYRISPDETNIGESRVFPGRLFSRNFFVLPGKKTPIRDAGLFSSWRSGPRTCVSLTKIEHTDRGGASGCHRCNVYIHTVDGSEIRRSPVEFFVTFFGMVKWPFQGLSDRQLGDQKVTLNHLVYILLFTGFILFRRLPSWGRSHIPSQPALLKMMIFGLSRLVGYAFSYWRVHISLFEDWVRVGWGVDPPPAVFLGNPTEIWSFTHHCCFLLQIAPIIFWIVCESTFYSDMPNWIDTPGYVQCGNLWLRHVRQNAHSPVAGNFFEWRLDVGVPSGKLR